MYSLLCVAYAFVHRRLPWIEYISKMDKKKCKKDLYERNNYVELRIEKREYFDQQLVKNGMALSPLFEYLITKQVKYAKVD